MSSADSEHPILLFDGGCGLCLRSVQFLLRHDRRHHLRFATLQGHVGRTLLKRAGHADMVLDTAVLIDARGQAHLLSDAPLRSLMSLGGVWRLVGILLVVPPPIRHRVYRYVATRRLAWFGRADACALTGPALGARLLDGTEN